MAPEMDSSQSMVYSFTYGSILANPQKGRICVYFSECALKFHAINKRFLLEICVFSHTDVFTQVVRLELRGTQKCTS